MMFVKMYTKLFVLVAFAVLSVNCFGAWATVDGVEYSYIVSSGQAAIKGAAVGDKTTLVIPASLDGYEVTSIGDSAFSGCSGLTSVSIPSSVTSIGSHAFSDCSGLKTVTIPSSVRNVDSYAFDDCSGLASITILEGVANLGRGAFYGCSGLRSVTIPSSVTNIASSCFCGCSGLTNMVLPFVGLTLDYTVESRSTFSAVFGGASYVPDGLRSVEITDEVIVKSGAFSGCSGLASVMYLSNVTNIGSRAFYGCSGLRTMIIPQSVMSIDSDAFSGCGGLIDLTIPSRVTRIGDRAFSGCNGLVSITISEGVVNIGGRAFSGCSGLTAITLPSSVTHIGAFAFYDCSELSVINLPSNMTNIDESAFRGCSGLKTMMLPPGVKSIGKSAFEDCCGLTSFLMPEGVANIESSAFSGCRGLTKLILPPSVTNIGMGAFLDCKGLTTMIIPTGVVNIFADTFQGCDELMSISLPSSVSFVGNYAFKDCNKLCEVHISDLTAWCNIEFIGSEANPLYYAHNLYCDGVKLTDVVIPDGVTKIKSYAFCGFSDMASVLMPTSVTKIASYSFLDCSGLATVTIPPSVSSIEYFSFHRCSSLTRARVAPVTNVDRIAFPDNVEIIRYMSVAVRVGGCSSQEIYDGCGKHYGVVLESEENQYNVGNVVNELPITPSQSGTYQINLADEMFRNTNENFEVTFIIDPAKPMSEMKILPRSVTLISGTASKNYDGVPLTCENLIVSGDGFVGSEGVTVDYTGSQLLPGSSDNSFSYSFKPGTEASNYNVAIANGRLTVYASGVVDIASGVTEITAGALKDCVEVTEVRIPDSVQFIGDGAFAGCTSLVKIDFPAGLDVTRAKLNSWGLSDEWIAQYCRIDDYLVAGATLIQYVGDATVKKLTVPAGIVRIDEGAFASLGGLEEIEFSGTEKIIGRGAFSQDTKLTKVILHEGIEQIDDEAFFGCTKMENVIIPSTVKSVGARAFKQCTALTNAQISYGVESIGEECFFSDWRIEQVDIPSTVTNIGTMAFGGDSSIIRVKLRADICPLSEIFSNYEHIREVGVKICDREVVDGCFRDCKELKDVFWEGNCPRLANDGRELYANTWHGDKNETLTTYVEEESMGWDGIEGSDQLPQAWPLVGSCRCSIAHKDLPTYLCQFDSNGGTLDVQDTYQYSERLVKLPPEPVQSGYKFGGWWTQPIGGLRVTENTIFIEGVYTYLWAHWIKGHTVFLDPNGGVIINSFVTYVDESVYGVLPSPVRSGYAFDGWLYDGHKIEPDSIMNTKADHTLLAQWRAAQYKVTYHPNGGTGNLVTEDRVYGETEVLRRNAFVRPGYEFLGWSTNESATSAEYKDAEPVTSLTVIDGEIIELWAVWKESEAVDPTNVELAFGGDADWFKVYQLVEAQAGGQTVCTPSFWQSGKIDDSERSDLTTKVFGAGKIGFWWRVDCEKVRTYKWDHLAFFVDNVEVAWTNGVTEWAYLEFAVDGSQEHDLIWRYQKDEEGFDGKDCGSVCAVVWTPRLETLEDYAGATNMILRTDGDAGWFGVKDEVHNQSGSVRSGVITDGQVSSLRSTVDGAGVIRFWWKTDCERVRNYPVDRVVFYVDGVEQAWTNGVSDWVQKHFTITGDGPHNVEWRYVKDEEESSGRDCAWVSEIEWEPLRVPTVIVVPAEITGGKEIVVDESWPASFDAQFGAGTSAAFVEKFGSDLSAALLKSTGKKSAAGEDMYVWQDYVAGTNPTDPKSQFTAKLEMVDGEPVIIWSPKLSEAEAAKRIYTTYGKKTLEASEPWSPVETPAQGGWRFFKIGVEMR